MKRQYLAIAAMLITLPLAAQDIYKVEALSSEDLNGTARYVGMGGAMNALGADLSTIGSNPAGIGLYRHSDAAMTGSLLIEPGAQSFNHAGKTRASFDQMGFVYVAPLNGEHLQFVNFGFNYQKRKNFKNFINTAGLTGGASQAFTAANLGVFYGDDYGWFDNNDQLNFDMPLTDAAYYTLMVDPDFQTDANGNTYVLPSDWNPTGAQVYNYRRGQRGGIQQYDFNLSLNFDNRWYFGATIGAYSVSWKSYLQYTEGIADAAGNLHDYYMSNDEIIDGSGVDFKLGFIGRPVEDSPFRVGIAFSSPIWYQLTGNNILYMNSPFVAAGSTDEFTEAGYRTGDFDYKVRTPWKLNLSVGTTVDNFLALDAEYEYKALNDASVRFPFTNGSDYNYNFFGTDWGNDRRDGALSNQLDTHLKGQHTFRIGAEARLAPEWSLRAGYNFVSAPFRKSAFLNLYPNAGTSYRDSQSLLNATGTDYVNLGSTNRFSLGLGYRGAHFYADVAWLYQYQSATVYPFHDTKYPYTSDVEVVADPGIKGQSYDLRRHSLMLTLGYRF